MEEIKEKEKVKEKRKYKFSELSKISKEALFVMCEWAETIEDISLFYENALFEVYENALFEVYEISPDEAKRKCFEKNNYGFKSFDDYHMDYIKHGGIEDHKDSVYPVIESNDLKDDEWLFDGWHRFHSYIKYYPKRNIPVIKIFKN